jgi:holliday junction DNA helicase RuvA
MIRSLTGTIARLGENSLVLEVHDIGYLIFTPTSRYPYLPGETITLHTHLAVRENALDLYGFTEPISLEFFELLLTVPKIGPKSALQIMHQADVSLLATAILEQDPDHLSKLSGIGKKTAANLVGHLEGKIDHLTLPKELGGLVAGTTLNQVQLDAIDALITLGYDAKEARTYVQKQDAGSDTKTIVQGALKQMPIP